MDDKIEIKFFNGHEARLKWDSNVEKYLHAIAEIISEISNSDGSLDYTSKIKDIENEHGIELSNMHCTFEIPDLKKDEPSGILRISQKQIS